MKELTTVNSEVDYCPLGKLQTFAKAKFWKTKNQLIVETKPR